MNFLARIVIGGCFIWILLYLLTATTTFGKDFFGSFIDDKAGPSIFIVIPILVAGSVGSILSIHDDKNDLSISAIATWLRTLVEKIFRITPSVAHYNTTPTTVNNRHRALLYVIKSALLFPLMVIQRILAFCIPIFQKGDLNFSIIGFRCLFIPLLCFTLNSVARKCSWTEQSRDGFFKEFANCFGIGALVGLGLLLVPVARHSIILESMGWNAVSAIQLHIWTGRFIILGVIVHGCIHLYRWCFEDNISLVHLLLPPPSTCWKQINDGEEMVSFEKSSVSCYEIFRNWTGLVAFVALLILGLSTLVRRRYYTIFYSIHIIAGPTVLLFVILHWNRSMVYIAGSALYYTACSFPVFTERLFSTNRSDSNLCSLIGSPTEITEVEAVKDKSDPSPTVFSITFRATPSAISQFQPGQYVYLRVPSISQISHPFTVNITTATSYHGSKECTSKLRIIFRPTGKFTKTLSKVLWDSNITQNDSTESERIIPKMYIDGFHGPCCRIEQVFQHDVTVIVAGGIGITPYLSLLHGAQDKYFNSAADSSNYTTDVRKVILHWVCREQSLIDYITREYFEPLLKKQREHSNSKHTAGDSKNLHISIVIHNTGRQQSRSGSSYIDIENPTDADTKFSHVGVCHNKQSTPNTDSSPFQPSVYSFGSKQSYLSNLWVFASFASISFLGFFVMWNSYKSLDSGKILLRLCSPLFIVLFGLVVSVTVNSLRANFSSNECSDIEFSSLKSGSDEDAEATPNLHHSKSMGLEMSAIQAPLASKEHSVLSSRDDESFSLDFAVSPNDNSLQIRYGRPSVHSFINELDTAESPGLFGCGPTKMLTEIREFVSDRCLARCRQCTHSHQPLQQTTRASSIAYYEEAFEK